MTKGEMIDALAETLGLPKSKAQSALESVFELLADDLKKTGRAAIPGFGTFTVRERAARKGRNPQTGEAVKIKASKTVGFKPAPTLKETVAKFKAPKK